MALSFGWDQRAPLRAISHRNLAWDFLFGTNAVLGGPVLDDLDVLSQAADV